MISQLARWTGLAPTCVCSAPLEPVGDDLASQIVSFTVEASAFGDGGRHRGFRRSVLRSVQIYLAQDQSDSSEVAGYRASGDAWRTNDTDLFDQPPPLGLVHARRISLRAAKA